MKKNLFVETGVLNSISGFRVLCIQKDMPEIGYLFSTINSDNVVTWGCGNARFTAEDVFSVAVYDDTPCIVLKSVYGK